MTKDTHIKSYDLRLKIPYTPPVECDKELIIVQDTMEDLRDFFLNYHKGKTYEQLWKIDHPQRIARVLTEVCESLKNAELIAIEEEGN